MQKLWYTAPARAWEEALPLGNGRIGAMVFGAVQHETILLNEITTAPTRGRFCQKSGN